MKTSFNLVSYKLTLALVILGCLFFTTQISAQYTSVGKPPEERAKFQTERMNELLPLENNQYQMVYDINLKYAKQVDELAQSPESKRYIFNKLRALHCDKDKELKYLLTKDQYKQYEKMEEDFQKMALERFKEMNRK